MEQVAGDRPCAGLFSSSHPAHSCWISDHPLPQCVCSRPPAPMRSASGQHFDLIFIDHLTKWLSCFVIMGHCTLYLYPWQHRSTCLHSQSCKQTCLMSNLFMCCLYLINQWLFQFQWLLTHTYRNQYLPFLNWKNNFWPPAPAHSKFKPGLKS